MTNLIGPLNILEAIREVKTDTTAILASSDKSYSSSSTGAGYSEAQNGHAKDPYSFSKSSLDALIRVYRDIYGLRVASARCSNIYGGGDLHRSRMMPNSVLNAIEGKPMIIHGDGMQVRDYLFVDDLVRGYILLAEYMQQGDFSLHYNFGTGRGTTTLEVIELLESIVRRKLKKEFSSEPIGTIRTQVNNCERAINDLAWEPLVTLENGLQKTWDWYYEHHREFATAMEC